MSKDYHYPQAVDEVIDRAQEPVGGATSPLSVAEDEIDWNRMPGFGPESPSEAIARIKQAEADMDRADKWQRSEDMWNSMIQRHPWLR